MLLSELSKKVSLVKLFDRVQDLRKKAGLVPTDDVGMEYMVLSDPTM